MMRLEAEISAEEDEGGLRQLGLPRRSGRFVRAGGALPRESSGRRASKSRRVPSPPGT